MKRQPLFSQAAPLALAFAFLALFTVATAGAQVPDNLGSGLRQLAEWHQNYARPLPPAQRQTALAAELRQHYPRAMTDTAQRVVVDVHLDGTVPSATVRASLSALGITVFAEHAAPAPGVRGGVLSAYLPVEHAAEAARVPGVTSISLIHRPWHRVGKVTSQGVTLLHADTVQSRGYTGRGITVGVISDSYNLTQPPASADVATDDLPGIGNPDGRTTPVVVLQDGDPTDPTNDDEGRAMLQIVHDMAPDAALAFCAVGPTQTTFVNAIRGLRTSNSVHCDILVDDIGFPDEPFFSDSIVAQAAEDVITDSELPGRNVIFYSAAGNQGGLGYDAIFNPVPDTMARAGGAGANNLKLSQVPDSLTSGGFHNFANAASGQVGIVQQLVVTGSDSDLDFQWDDPFLAGLISTDYNILIFDANGNYLAAMSGTDNSFSTDEALQMVTLTANADGSDTPYQLVIARGVGGTGASTHIRYIVNSIGLFQQSNYYKPNVPAIFGHTGAQDVDAVAAYDALGTLQYPEDYSALGPVTIAFDTSGNRYAVPNVRRQPTLAAVDDVATTFFPQGGPYNAAGFPLFTGTSAAAPHLGGAAALLLQAAGGPGSLTAAQMRSLLESTADAHDLTPSFISATLTSADGLSTITVSGSGDASDSSAVTPDFFTVTFNGPAGSELRRLNINLAPAGENYNATGQYGYPFTVGAASGGTNPAGMKGLVFSTGGASDNLLSVLIPPRACPSGGSFSFGINRNNAATSAGGNSADLLQGGIVSAGLRVPGTPHVSATGTFQNQIGTGYSVSVGWGLVNVNAALTQLLGHP